MVINALIVVVSLLLLVYWFRYTCLLVLKTGSSRSYAQQVASANNLNFPRVKNELAEAGQGRDLDRLEALLERDYRLMKYLIDNCASFRPAGFEVERCLLHIDFHVLKAAYAISRRLSVSEGQRAIQEMAEIIGHLAHGMGERAALAAAR